MHALFRNPHFESLPLTPTENLPSMFSGVLLLLLAVSLQSVGGGGLWFFSFHVIALRLFVG